jgi:hypothetical protein
VAVAVLIGSPKHAANLVARIGAHLLVCARNLLHRGGDVAGDLPAFDAVGQHSAPRIDSFIE